jgi:hypothetical protein
MPVSMPQATGIDVGIWKFPMRVRMKAHRVFLMNSVLLFLLVCALSCSNKRSDVVYSANEALGAKRTGIILEDRPREP